MRLSAELFTAADGAMLDVIRQAVLVSASGRYGLYKTAAPFELALNITSNMVEVISLTCNAVTKNGTLIDINFDSSYTNTFDSRVAIPANATDEAYLLVIRMHRVSGGVSMRHILKPNTHLNWLARTLRLMTIACQ